MTASDHLNPQQFKGDAFDAWDDYQASQQPDEPEPAEWNPGHMFHGTAAAMKPGDTVSPGHANNFAGVSHNSRGTQVYATTSPRDAYDYAKNAAGGRPGVRPRVYEVS